MTTIISDLNTIGSFHGITGKGTQGVGNFGNAEAALHEVCHVVVLGIPRSVTFINPDGTSYMEEYVSDRSGELGGHPYDATGEDWSEIKTLSCQVHVMRRARMLVSLPRFYKDSEGVSWNGMLSGRAIQHVKEHVRTKASHHLADEVIVRVRLLSRAAREWSQWDERMQRDKRRRDEQIKRANERFERRRRASMQGMPVPTEQPGQAH